MATRTSVTFVDDIDGTTEGVERYTFSWLGTDYAIDLAPKSAKKLVDVMNLYTDKARPVHKARAVSGGRGRRAARGRAPREHAPAVRAWAREQGLEVSDLGRVSQAVMEAYDQAH